MYNPNPEPLCFVILKLSVIENISNIVLRSSSFIPKPESLTEN